MDIRKILRQAPKGATHWNVEDVYLRAEKSGYMMLDDGEWDYQSADDICDTHRLDDLKEIQRLRAENSALKAALNIALKAALNEKSA